MGDPRGRGRARGYAVKLPGATTIGTRLSRAAPAASAGGAARRAVVGLRDRQTARARHREPGFDRLLDFAERLGRGVAESRTRLQIRHIGDPGAVRLRPEQVD